MNRFSSTKPNCLSVMVGLLAGLCVSTVGFAQETATRSIDERSNELVAPSAQPALGEASENAESSAGQVMVTQNTRGRVETVRIRPEDDVWLISARNSHCAPSDLSLLRCTRLRNENWTTVELDDLVEVHANDKSKVTMLYVHGDRTDLERARSRGLQFYQSAFQTVERPPVRFVIFAWRAEKERTRRILDYDLKSRRSVAIGETLATLLCRFRDREMVVGGFSLGAQVVLSAMSKPKLQNRGNVRGKYRVAVFAHVLNSDLVKSKLAHFPHNPIVQQTDVFLNHDDRAIKLAELIERKRNRRDVSLVELAYANKAAINSIRIRDITDEISKQHSISSYASSPLLHHKMADSLHASFDGSSRIAEVAPSDSIRISNLPAMDSPVNE